MIISFFGSVTAIAQDNSDLKLQLDRAIELQKENRYEASISLLTDKLPAYAAAPDSLLGLAYHKLGAAYFNTYQEKAAIAAYQRALAIRKQILSYPHADIAKTNRLLGVAHFELGNYTAAQNFLKQALAEYQQLQLSNQIMLTALELGRTYEAVNDIEKSKEFSKSALEYLQLENNEYSYLIPASQVVLANLYYRQDSLDEAITYAQRGIDEIANWTEKYDEDYHLLADAYNTLAISYQQKKVFPTALAYHEKSLAINQRYADLRQERVAATYVNLGMLYKEKNAPEQAAQYFAQAMTIDSLLNNALNLGGIHSNLGELYLQEKQVERALEHFETALTYLLPDWSASEGIFAFDFSKNIIGDQNILLDVLKGMANTYRLRHRQEGDLPNLRKALELYTISTALIDRSRFSLQREGSKRFLSNTTQPILAEGLATAVQLYEITDELQYAERAFEFSERSKALILLEAVNTAKAKNLAGIPIATREREQFLAQKTTYFTQQLFNERQSTAPDLERLKLLNDSLLYYNTATESLLSSIERDYPQYFQYKHSLMLFNIENTRKKILTEEKQIIEYSITDSIIYVFHLTNKDVAIHRIPRDFPLVEWIEDLTAGITDNYSSVMDNDPRNYDELYLQRATQLYEKLWSFLDFSDTPKLSTIVIPDGVLGYIPFAALLTEPVDNQRIKDYNAYPFLIKNHSISYSYSATLLGEQLHRPATSTTKNLLAFAPTFGQLSLSLAANDRSGLAPLLHNRREVKSIAEIIDGQVVYGADANRATFLQQAPDYRYLHLSSHARMNDRKPEYSYVSFTQTLDDSLDKSEVLYVDDLYNIPLNADMVVLSACETAAGKLSRGEGIISLARAFSYAGARSIITTLWRVNDQKSADLMIDFYKNLADGAPKDVALRNAQLRLIEEGTAAHPYFWAGFVPLGNMEAIETKSFWWTWYLLGFGGLLLVVVGFLLKARMPQRTAP